MKYCPTCRYCFEDTFSFCNRDQVELISAYAGPRAISHKYSVDRLLSESVTGNVYAGKRLETERPVALKFLVPPLIGDPEAGKLFRREALAIAHLNTRINHQHVAQTIDYGQLSNGTPYIVMELVAGASLSEHLRGAADHPPLHFVVNIARQVADGLWAAHRCGVTHRSLNSSNVLLAHRYDGPDEAKIINFGFSKLRKQSALIALDPEDLLAYQAPEQRAGHESDTRSDIYALGVLLYEMLMGGPHALKSIAAWSRHPTSELLFPAKLSEELPQPLYQILTQALRKNPAERLNSAADMAHQLSTMEETIRLGASTVSEGTVENSLIEVTEYSPLPISHNAFVKSGLAAPGSPASYILNNNNLEDSAAKVIDAPKIESPSSQSNHYQTAPTFERQVERETQSKNLTLTAHSQDEGVESDHEASAASAVFDAGSKSKPHGRRRPQLVYAAVAAALAFAVIAAVYLQWSQKTLPTNVSQAPHQAFDTEQVAPPVVTSAEISTLPEADDELPVTNEESRPNPKNEEVVTEIKQTSISKSKTTATAAMADLETKQPNTISVEAPDQAQQNVSGALESEQDKPVTSQKGSGPIRCDITTSASEINLMTGSAASITVMVDGEVDATHIRPTTKDWANIVVFPESRPGQGGNSAKFSIISVSQRQGDYSVNFKTPCGSRNLAVKVNGR